MRLRKIHNPLLAARGREQNGVRAAENRPLAKN
jgi:hypothetical protein